jgi:hypothetical protein
VASRKVLLALWRADPEGRFHRLPKKGKRLVGRAFWIIPVYAYANEGWTWRFRIRQFIYALKRRINVVFG